MKIRWSIHRKPGQVDSGGSNPFSPNSGPGQGSSGPGSGTKSTLPSGDPTGCDSGRQELNNSSEPGSRDDDENLRSEHMFSSRIETETARIRSEVGKTYAEMLRKFKTQNKTDDSQEQERIRALREEVKSAKQEIKDLTRRTIFNIHEVPFWKCSGACPGQHYCLEFTTFRRRRSLVRFWIFK